MGSPFIVLMLVAASQVATAYAMTSEIVPRSNHSLVEGDPTTRTFLRAPQFDLSNEEERGPLSAQLESATKALTKNEQWLKGEKSTDHFSELLKLDKASDDLLSSPKLQSWVSYMDHYKTHNPNSRVSLFDTLTTHYEDDRLAEIIEASMLVPDTEKMAKRLQIQLFYRWMTEGKAPNRVFGTLKLDQAGDELLSDIKLQSLARYIDYYNERRPLESQTTLLETLLTHYKDDGLVEIIEASKLNPASANMAEQLESELFEHWMRRQKKTHHVFKLLKLDQAGVKVLASPKLQSWMRFLDHFNEENPKSHATFFGTLLGHYKIDRLAEIIEVSKLDPATASMAKQLELELFEHWHTRMKYHNNMFLTLELEKAGDKLLASPKLQFYMNYLAYAKIAYEDKGPTQLIGILLTHYTAKRLVEIIETSKLNPVTAKLAEQVESELMDYWVMQKKVPSDVFRTIKPESIADAGLRVQALATYVDKFKNKYPEIQSTLFQNLLLHYSDNTLIEIIEAMKLDPATKSAAKRVQTEMFDHWLKQKKTPDRVFVWLQLDRARDQLVSSLKLRSWVNFADHFKAKHPDSQMTLIETLLTHYTVDRLAEIIEASKLDPAAENMAQRLRTELFEHLLMQEQRPQNVFVMLKLNQAGDELLASPKLESCIRYINYFKEKHPDSQMTLIKVLLAHYTDDRLAEIIEASKLNPATADVAKELQTGLFEHWLMQRKEPHGVFKLMNFVKESDELPSSPKLRSWINFVVFFMEKNPNSQITLIKALAAHFTDERLAEVIEAMKLVPAAENVAKRLHAELLDRWTTQRKTPEGIFNLLKLAGDELPSGLMLQSWISFTNHFKEKNPNSRTTLFKILTTYYKDDRLVDIIEAIKLNPATESVGKQLQTELFERLLTQEKTPSDVFKVIKLDKVSDELPPSSKLRSWMSFVVYYMEKNPDSQMTLIKALLAHYKDTKLIKIIQALKLDPAAENVAKQLRTELFNHWLSQEKAFDYAFRLLKLDKAGDDLLFSPKLQSWVSFMDHFNEKNPESQTTLLKTLLAHYDDEELVRIIHASKLNPAAANMAERLKSELFEHWLTQHDKPQEVFKLMKLDKAGDKLLSSPTLQSWVSFMDHFNEKNPESQTTLLKTLLAHYKDDRLAKLIYASKLDPATANAAEQLRTELFNHWLTQKETPINVFKLLKLDTAGHEPFKRTPFFIWNEYVEFFGQMNPLTKTTCFSELLKLYDEQTLVNVLIAMIEFPAARKLAVQLFADQKKFWLKRKRSPAEVFTLFKLDEVKDDLFEKPLFTSWMKYLSDFNDQVPLDKTTVLLTLVSKYPDNILVQILYKAGRFRRTEGFSLQLQEELKKYWFETAQFTPSDVYSRLALKTPDLDEQTRFNLFRFWLSYLTYCRGHTQQYESSGIVTLADDTHENVLQMLQKTAKGSTLPQTVEKELKHQVHIWRFTKEPPDVVDKWRQVINELYPQEAGKLRHGG